ncbi:Gfo/Idh/MocA family protein [Streptantibioticus silvisoli]|uniref:Gfo/Idh/MocA family oxidoreductase n=1 Tax=Streptantibioticus silvisoli TaxID=2705255 RepID=A0ABT6W412_9ACTN|nr:Gfo/Idh/MocA family oxidoreductase [Streptantibioticus silvisoli]MDI5965488.1 Gfo/Idh/MocA family oxidoreductase [Streptantibioticus silvisoli]
MSEERRRRVRLGVIGLGVMGSRTLDCALSHPDYVVPLAADLGAGAVERTRASHPDLTFTTPAELVASGELDAVYIATPPASHARLAVDALRSGKAVFCEKPLAVSPADGRLMLDAATATGLANAVNFPLADTPATLHVERALAAGEAGEVRGVDIRLTFPLWPRPFQATAVWVGERAEGGFVREVFSHFAYLTDRLAGPLRPVRTGLRFPGDPAASESDAHGLLYAGEVPVHVTGRAGVAGPETYEWVLWGTRRSYLLRDWRDLFVSDGGAWTPVDPGGLPERGEGSRLTSFARAVRGEPFGDLADFAAALRVQEAVEAFHGTDGGGVNA